MLMLKNGLTTAPRIKSEFQRDDKAYPIPSGKAVKFYLLRDFDEDLPLDPVHTITGKTQTTEGRIFGTVPAGLNGEDCYLLAIVVLKDDFDLKGKTKGDILQAVGTQEILLGQISDDQEGWKRYRLTPDLIIEDFEFVGLAMGKPLPGKITFVIPAQYQTGEEENPEYFDMPGGKPIDFYFTTESGKNIFDSNALVTSGTTPVGGGPIDCDLPGELIGEQRYVHAIIRLKGNFDFRGTSLQDLFRAFTQDRKRTHHVIVLMFKEMAMPGVLSGIWSEPDNNPCHLPRQRTDRIFPPQFIPIRPHRRAGENQLVGAVVMSNVKGLTIQDLKLNLMDMDGVRGKTGVD